MKKFFPGTEFLKDIENSVPGRKLPPSKRPAPDPFVWQVSGKGRSMRRHDGVSRILDSVRKGASLLVEQSGNQEGDYVKKYLRFRQGHWFLFFATFIDGKKEKWEEPITRAIARNYVNKGRIPDLDAKAADALLQAVKGGDFVEPPPEALQRAVDLFLDK
ncbi:MAG: hypothetical protein HYS52_00265 [Candidatus Wildermuthbacteria bacterium]|nr:hypothetical protein [Candidatus Wildermuthbacteria bacterium]